MVQIPSPTSFLAGAQAVKRPSMSPLQALATGQQMQTQRSQEGRALALQPGKLAAQQRAAQTHGEAMKTLDKNRTDEETQTKRVRAGLLFHSAMTMVPEKQNAVLKQAADLVGPDDPMSNVYTSAMDLPEGEKRQKAMFQLYELNRGLGAYGDAKPEWGEKGDGMTPYQRATIQGDRDSLEVRKAELAQRELEDKLDREELSPTIQKDLIDTQEKFSQTARELGEYEGLVSKMDEAIAADKGGGGVITSFQEWAKKFMGIQDMSSITDLRNKLKGMRAASAVQNLPPGVASDKDIELALSGFPKQNAPMETYRSWIKGMEKLKRIDYIYREALSEYVSGNENRGRAGWLQNWKENKNRLILGADKLELAYSPETLKQLRKTAKKPASQEEFDKLPIGAVFINPSDGKVYTKRQ